MGYKDTPSRILKEWLILRHIDGDQSRSEINFFAPYAICAVSILGLGLGLMSG
ncbi:hypothetical protein [Campylobacter sp. 19-13652]|uniref:hypothetical protein n=1 Tax=Campylobacter sp. 19-13652 TaxID=2840180 RepID=UPI001C86221B|nr:hypothetical protein [Campylobacter sp. 19-13652]